MTYYIVNRVGFGYLMYKTQNLSNVPNFSLLSSSAPFSLNKYTHKHTNYDPAKINKSIAKLKTSLIIWIDPCTTKISAPEIKTASLFDTKKWSLQEILRQRMRMFSSKDLMQAQIVKSNIKFSKAPESSNLKFSYKIICCKKIG